MNASRHGAADDPDDNHKFDETFEALTAQLADLDVDLTTEPGVPDPPAATAAASTPPSASVPSLHQERTAAPPAPPSPANTEKATTLPDIEAPPELVIPPEPEVETSVMVNWWANAFPHLVWLSVVSGLVGQIYGWTETFGGGLVAIAVACVLGGTFEFIMVAASSRGLRDIGRGRPIWQALAFLTAGTSCMAMAFWMNLHHFTGALELAGMAAAASTAIGYTAHVAVHLFDELDNRAKRAAWQKECDRITAEIRAREEKTRAEHDAYQAELRKARAEELKTRTQHTAPQLQPTTTAVATTPRPAAAETPKPEIAAKAPARKPVPAKEIPAKDKVSKDEVLTWALRQEEPPTSGEVLRHFEKTGRELPTDRAVRNWLADIKQS